MNPLKQGKTNWKYILIVVILAIITSGGIFIYQKGMIQEMIPLLVEFPEIKKPEKKEEIRIPEQIISQINKNTDFINWFNSWQATNPSLDIYDFLKVDIWYEKDMWPELIIGEEQRIRTSCPSEFTVIEAREFYSPDKTKYIYFPCNIGSPDTVVWLYNRNGDKKMELIEETGPSGGVNGAFWVDNTHFVILKQFRNDSEKCSAYISYWDLMNKKHFLYEASGLNCQY